MTSVRTPEIIEAVRSIVHHACSMSMIDLSDGWRMITPNVVVQTPGRVVTSPRVDDIGKSVVFLVAREVLFLICSRMRLRFIFVNILTPVEN